MKTQINEIVYGSPSTVGTPHAIRAQIEKAIFTENPAHIVLKIEGIFFLLKKAKSLSGKTEWFSCEISTDSAKKICGYKCDPFVFKSKAALEFTGSEVIVHWWTKKTNGSQWKPRRQERLLANKIFII